MSLYHAYKSTYIRCSTETSVLLTHTSHTQITVYVFVLALYLENSGKLLLIVQSITAVVYIVYIPTENIVRYQSLIYVYIFICMKKTIATNKCIFFQSGFAGNQRLLFSVSNKCICFHAGLQRNKILKSLWFSAITA